jgi:glycosyltransferase involved in cell wall biosynthesis
MKISLIIPTYKKKDIVLDQLERLHGYLSRINPNFELIFVIDGYIDNTKELLESYIKENGLKNIQVLGYEKNMGKGYAVRYGLVKATGDIVGFTDADTDILIRTLGNAIKEIKTDYTDIVIPSKFHLDSNINMTFGREILSYGLVYLNKILLRLPKNVSDVGCGLKLFRKEVAKNIFKELSINGFAFDSELINEIGKQGWNVSIVPLYLSKNRDASTSANVKTTFNMVRDILKISLKQNFRVNVKKDVKLGVYN